MTPLLQGIRIVEVGGVVLGPLAGQILADLGAEIIKVEPLSGDIARASHPHRDGTGALFVNNNRNKRAIAMDLKTPQGMEVLTRLVRRSDVFFHNMRVEAAERIGIGYEAVQDMNADILYCSAIGFGQRGRYRDRPAFDDVIQAACGIAGLSAHLGEEPRFVPTILADKVAALHVVYGILAALVARCRGRRGAIHIEVPMFESMVSFLLNEHLADATFDTDGALGYPRVFATDRRPYRTSDGWIAVLPYTAGQWRRFLIEVNRTEICSAAWFTDASERGQRINELYGIVADALPLRTTMQWIARLSELDVPCSEINRLEDLLVDPHLADVDFFATDKHYSSDIRRMLPQPVVFDGLERCADRPPPRLGADTYTVLEECGYTRTDIEAMFDRKIVAGPAGDIATSTGEFEG